MNITEETLIKLIEKMPMPIVHVRAFEFADSSFEDLKKEYLKAGYMLNLETSEAFETCEIVGIYSPWDKLLESVNCETIEVSHRDLTSHNERIEDIIYGDDK